MSCVDLYTPELRARGYRMTSQRMAILHMLHHAGTHLSPTEIFDTVKKELPGLTEPTVYRTLEFLAENGLVHPALQGNGHRVYQIAGNDHHHLVCRACGSEVEVDHALLKKLYQQLEIASGYKLTDSHISFFGLCPDCR
jgi:Fur family transcriptional regulator, ferric uptake regulator